MKMRAAKYVRRKLSYGRDRDKYSNHDPVSMNLKDTRKQIMNDEDFIFDLKTLLHRAVLFEDNLQLKNTLQTIQQHRVLLDESELNIILNVLRPIRITAHSDIQALATGVLTRHEFFSIENTEAAEVLEHAFSLEGLDNKKSCNFSFLVLENLFPEEFAFLVHSKKSRISALVPRIKIFCSKYYEKIEAKRVVFTAEFLRNFLFLIRTQQISVLSDEKFTVIFDRIVEVYCETVSPKSLSIEKQISNLEALQTPVGKDPKNILSVLCKILRATIYRRFIVSTERKRSLLNPTVVQIFSKTIELVSDAQFSTYVRIEGVRLLGVIGSIAPKFLKKSKDGKGWKKYFTQSVERAKEDVIETDIELNSTGKIWHKKAGKNKKNRGFLVWNSKYARNPFPLPTFRKEFVYNIAMKTILEVLSKEFSKFRHANIIVQRDEQDEMEYGDLVEVKDVVFKERKVCSALETFIELLTLREFSDSFEMFLSEAQEMVLDLLSPVYLETQHEFESYRNLPKIVFLLLKALSVIIFIRGKKDRPSIEHLTEILKFWAEKSLDGCLLFYEALLGTFEWETNHHIKSFNEIISRKMFLLFAKQEKLSIEEWGLLQHFCDVNKSTFYYCIDNEYLQVLLDANIEILKYSREKRVRILAVQNIVYCLDVSCGYDLFRNHDIYSFTRRKELKNPYFIALYNLVKDKDIDANISADLEHESWLKQLGFVQNMVNVEIRTKRKPRRINSLHLDLVMDELQEIGSRNSKYDGKLAVTKLVSTLSELSHNIVLRKCASLAAQSKLFSSKVLPGVLHSIMTALAKADILNGCWREDETSKLYQFFDDIDVVFEEAVNLSSDKALDRYVLEMNRKFLSPSQEKLCDFVFSLGHENSSMQESILDIFEVFERSGIKCVFDRRVVFDWAKADGREALAIRAMESHLYDKIDRLKKPDSKDIEELRSCYLKVGLTDNALSLDSSCQFWLAKNQPIAKPKLSRPTLLKVENREEEVNDSIGSMIRIIERVHGWQNVSSSDKYTKAKENAVFDETKIDFGYKLRREKRKKFIFDKAVEIALKKTKHETLKTKKVQIGPTTVLDLVEWIKNDARCISSRKSKQLLNEIEAEMAEKFLQNSRVLYEELASFISEAQQAADLRIILKVSSVLQQYEALGEDLGDNQSFTSLKDDIKSYFDKRLRSTVKNASNWLNLLAVRSLLFTPKEDLFTWISMAQLCRKTYEVGGLKTEKIFAELGVSNFFDVENCAVVKDISCSEPAVAFEYYKWLWKRREIYGKKKGEKQNIKLAENFVLEGMFNLYQKIKDQDYPLTVRVGRKFALFSKQQAETSTLIRTDLNRALEVVEGSVALSSASGKCFLTYGDFLLFFVSRKLRDGEAIGSYVTVGKQALDAFTVALNMLVSKEKESGEVFGCIFNILKVWELFAFSPDFLNHLEEKLDDFEVLAKPFLVCAPQLLSLLNSDSDRVAHIASEFLFRLGKLHPLSVCYSVILAADNYYNTKIRARTLLKRFEQDDVVGSYFKQAIFLQRRLINIGFFPEELWYKHLLMGYESYRAGKESFDQSVASLQLGYRLYFERFHSEYGRSANVAKFERQYWRRLSRAYLLLREYRSVEDEDVLHEVWNILIELFRQMERSVAEIRASYALEELAPDLVDLSKVPFDIYLPGTSGFGTDPGEKLTIESFDSNISLLFSKQKPRKIGLTASDGKKYVYLVKGNEDMRQDERFMQFYGIANYLFNRNKHTANTKLTRYPVIPLTIEVGMCGWMLGAQTLHHILAQHRHVHQIRNEEELRILDSKISNDRMNFTCAQAKEKQYAYSVSRTQFCSNNLDTFLFASSLTPTHWLKKRERFTTSLAAQCIVGYLLGLGDRHTGNIMIGTDTSNVILIDFADSFDVNLKREKHPETVPFRLTPQLTRALGPAGLLGTFQSISVLTLKLLRKNKDVFSSLMNLFVTDPVVITSVNKQNVDNSFLSEEGFENLKRQLSLGNMRDIEEDTQFPEILPRAASGPLPTRVRELLDASDDEVAAKVAEIESLPFDVTFQLPKPHQTEKEVVEIFEKKLNGTMLVFASMSFKQLLLEEQVRQLIDEATSSMNLGLMYKGWSPQY
eukprot:augustus_masked-scaffold_7-processed-gene-13.4-mRNA-1 protein AED:0.45 eAED:0.47 QI:0/-1/0/1/-1/1/1/0/2093